MKLKDETIDSLVKETRIGDALFWVLVDSYSSVKPKLTAEMKEFKEQFLEQDDFKIVNETFTVTRNKLDFVENSFSQNSQFIFYI